MKRTVPIVIAAVLTMLISLYSIIFAIPLLARGSEAAQAADSPPWLIAIITLVFGVLGLVGAWGLWSNQRWGKILTIAIMAINGLSALPGVFSAPSDSLRIFAIASVLVGVAVIVLVLLPVRQTAAVHS